MLLATFSKVSKNHGGNLIFDEIDLEILDGDRIGLVGENGSGKSTLMRLLARFDAPTEGAISLRKNLSVGYLRQEIDPEQLEKTVFTAVTEASPELMRLAAALRDYESRMMDPVLAGNPDEMERVIESYGVAQQRFESLGGYTMENNVETVLHGLGFAPAQYRQRVVTLSGGEKKRVNLARLLLAKPELLLLDEPDNHLDLEAKAWLEEYIQTYPGAVLIISHDRRLLDRVTRKILELEDGQISVYHGNYTYYAEERRRRLEKRHELYTQQQEEIKRLETTLHELKQWARQNPKFAPRAESMEKRVERARHEATERPIMTRRTLRLDLQAERSGRKVLEAERLSLAAGGRVLCRPFNLALLYSDRVGIVGPNGSGKTTLMRTLMGLLPPATGEVRLGASVAPGYYSQEQETLPFEKNLLEFIRSLKPLTEQQAINVLRKLLFSYHEFTTPIAKLSGGEKSRLQIARLMLTDANFLLLDEPTNNLDLASIEVLESALDQFEGTILTVSHDRYFLDTIVTKILAIDEDGRVRLYPGNYSYYVEKTGRA